MFRSLGLRLAEFAALGVLLGTVFSLLAFRPPTEVRVPSAPLCRPAESACSSALASPPPRPAPVATILDVAAGVSPLDLGTLVHLEPGEHVVAVDDVPVHGDLDAGSRLALRAPGGRTFVDLDLRGPGGARRVIVLMH